MCVELESVIDDAITVSTLNMFGSSVIKILHLKVIHLFTDFVNNTSRSPVCKLLILGFVFTRVIHLKLIYMYYKCLTQVYIRHHKCPSGWRQLATPISNAFLGELRVRRIIYKRSINYMGDINSVMVQARGGGRKSIQQGRMIRRRSAPPSIKLNYIKSKSTFHVHPQSYASRNKNTVVLKQKNISPQNTFNMRKDLIKLNRELVSLISLFLSGHRCIQNVAVVRQEKPGCAFEADSHHPPRTVHRRGDDRRSERVVHDAMHR